MSRTLLSKDGYFYRITEYLKEEYVAVKVLDQKTLDTDVMLWSLYMRHEERVRFPKDEVTTYDTGKLYNLLISRDKGLPVPKRPLPYRETVRVGLTTLTDAELGVDNYIYGEWTTLLRAKDLPTKAKDLISVFMKDEYKGVKLKEESFVDLCCCEEYISPRGRVEPRFSCATFSLTLPPTEESLATWKTTMDKYNVDTTIIAELDKLLLPRERREAFEEEALSLYPSNAGDNFNATDVDIQTLRVGDCVPLYTSRGNLKVFEVVHTKGGECLVVLQGKSVKPQNIQCLISLEVAGRTYDSLWEQNRHLMRGWWNKVLLKEKD